MYGIMPDTCGLGDPSVDPEVASSCLDLVEKYFPSYFNTILGNHEVALEFTKILVFSIISLMKSEIMPRRSAARFWV